MTTRRWSQAWYGSLFLIVLITGYSGGGASAAVQDPSNMIKEFQAYIKASNAERPDIFGSQVAISGDTLAVGAWHEASCAPGINGDQNNNACEFSGAAYVFV